MELTGMNLSISLRKILLTVCTVVFFSIGVSAQNIDIMLKDVTVQTAIMELQKKYGYSVVVKSTELDLSKVISVNLVDKPVKDVVAAIFDGQEAGITITGKNIVVAKAKPTDPVKSITVKGVIKDETGIPVIGAAVFQKGDSGNGVVTGLDGDFSITVPSDAYLAVSCIGYKDASVAVGGNASLNITLAVDSELLEDAIVVGYGVVGPVRFLYIYSGWLGNNQRRCWLHIRPWLHTKYKAGNRFSVCWPFRMLCPDSCVLLFLVRSSFVLFPNKDEH